MSVVVGIDPSLSSAGIAILVDGRPRYLRSVGSPAIPGLAGHYGERSDRIGRQCRQILAAIDGWTERTGHDWPELAVIEGQAFGANLPSTSESSGLWWRLYASLRGRGVPIAVIAPKTRALWATGSGDADKAAVKAAVRAWWPHARDHIRNDDIADAAALALAGALHCGDPMPFPVKPQHHNRLKAAQWPSVSRTKPEPPQVGAPR